MTWRYTLVVVYLLVVVWFSLLNWEWMTTPFLVQVFPGVRVEIALLPLVFLFHLLYVVILDTVYRIYTGMLQRENVDLRIKLQDEEKRDFHRFAQEIRERLDRIESRLNPPADSGGSPA